VINTSTPRGPSSSSSSSSGKTAAVAAARGGGDGVDEYGEDSFEEENTHTHLHTQGGGGGQGGRKKWDTKEDTKQDTLQKLSSVSAANTRRGEPQQQDEEEVENLDYLASSAAAADAQGDYHISINLIGASDLFIVMPEDLNTASPKPYVIFTMSRRQVKSRQATGVDPSYPLWNQKGLSLPWDGFSMLHVQMMDGSAVDDDAIGDTYVDLTAMDLQEEQGQRHTLKLENCRKGSVQVELTLVKM